MKNIFNWVKVALGIIFAVLVYLFFTKKDNRKIKKAIDEVNEKVNIEKAKVKEIEKRIITRKKKAKIRKEKAKELSNDLGKYFNKG